MTATTKVFQMSDEEYAEATPSTFDALVVPADYEATLESVEDYETERSEGWKATFRIEGLPFQYWIAHSQKARFKLVEFVHAFEPGFFDVRDDEGVTYPVDPNVFVGRTVAAHVTLDEGLDTPRKVIDYLFSVDEDEPSPEDVPTL